MSAHFHLVGVESSLHPKRQAFGVKSELLQRFISQEIKDALNTMESEIRTVVTFESTAFNVSKTKDYFINPGCFGDDVAEWLIGELRKQGVVTDGKPGQEDFGWYLNFEATGVSHTFVIGYRPNGETEAGTWIGWLERKRGLIGSILGGRKRGIEAAAAEAIHQILSRSPLVRDPRWYFQNDFDSGHERGAASPLTPT